MPSTTTIRRDFDAPVCIGEAWQFTKGPRVAVCEGWTHPLGWELRLVVGDLVRSQVVRSSNELLDVQADWKQAMETRGWCAVACDDAAPGARP